MMRNNTSPMMHMRIYDEDVQKGTTPGAGGIFPCRGLEKALVLLRASSFPPSSRNQPVQQQQRRLLPALPAHIAHQQVLHVHGGIQPEVRTAVLCR